MSQTSFTQHPIFPGFPVFAATDFCTDGGPGRRSPLAVAEHLLLEETFVLAPGAVPHHLPLERTAHPRTFTNAQDPSARRSGAVVYLDCVVALMTPNGQTIEAAILVEIAPGGEVIADTYLFPFTPLVPGTSYTLIHVETDDLDKAFAKTACLGFVHGTRLSLATGEAKPVETLQPGDLLLTRDQGAQEVRWIGRTHQRAVGGSGFMRFAAGCVNNAQSLTLAATQRLIRGGGPDWGTSPATLDYASEFADLKGAQRITEGVFDTVEILIDGHGLVYAEGVAVEPLVLNPAFLPDLTVAAIPRWLTPQPSDAANDQTSPDTHPGMTLKAAFN